jgi:hypothetical protein
MGKGLYHPIYWNSIYNVIPHKIVNVLNTFIINDLGPFIWMT